MITEQGIEISRLLTEYLDSFKTDEERRELLSFLTEGYCIHCGCKELHNKCQCWNDE